MQLIRWGVGLAVLAAMVQMSASASAALQFVNSTTANGSFETGAISPWAPFSNPNPAPVVISDPSIASDGQFYAQIAATTSSFTSNFIVASSPPLDPAHGTVIRLDWEARIPASGDVFSAVASSAWGTDPSDSITTNVTFVQGGPLSSAAWTHNIVDVSIDPAKMSSLPSLHLALGYSRFSPVAGHTYLGWIDQVTMTQIPEPSGVAMCAAAAMLTARRRRG